MRSPSQSSESSNREVRPITWKRVIGFLLPISLIVIYLFAQVAFLRPPALDGGDQLDYFSAARDLPDVTPTHRHLRLGLVIPVRAAIAVFGYSEAAYYTVPFLSGVGLALATYALGRMLFTKWVGFLAGALVILNPYVLWESSHLLPDITSTALVTGGLTLLIYASRQSAEPCHRVPPALLFSVAGLLLGWAYLVREYIVLVYPVALLVWVLYKPRLRHIVLTSAGALSMLAFEMTWGWVVYQNPLQRISVVIGRSATSLSPAAQERVAQAISEGTLQWQQPLSDLVMILPNQFMERSGGEFYVILIVLVTVALVVSLVPAARNNSVLVTGVWAIIIFGALTVIAGTPGPSGRVIIRLHKIRYWFPVLPALLVGGFGALAVGATWLRRRTALSRPFAGVGITVLALFVGWTAAQGVDSIAHSGSFIKNGGGSHYFELRDWLANEGQQFDGLWTDTTHGRAFELMLPMYARTFWGAPIWEGAIRSFATPDRHVEPEEIDQPLVLNRLSLSGLRTMPDYIVTPPSSWSTELVSSNGQLLVLNPQPASQARVSLVEAGSESPTPWMVVPRRGATFEDSETWDGGTLQLENGDHVYLLDSGTAGFEEPESEIKLAQETRVRGHVTVRFVQPGSMRLLCLFYDPSGERHTKPAWSVMDLSHAVESEASTYDFFCQSPSDSDSYRFRMAVELRHSLEIEALHLEAGTSALNVDVGG